MPVTMELARYWTTPSWDRFQIPKPFTRARDYLAPLSSTVLEGVRHVALPTGHSGLLVDAAVADVLDELLRA